MPWLAGYRGIGHDRSSSSVYCCCPDTCEPVSYCRDDWGNSGLLLCRVHHVGCYSVGCGELAKGQMQIVNIDPSSLIHYARNPRRNDSQVDRMVGAIKEFGFKVPILAKSDGTVIDGHLRLKAAAKMGLADVPVIYADDLSDAQVKAFRILANKSVEWAEWDDELLKLELEELNEIGFDLELTGLSTLEIENALFDGSSFEMGSQNEQGALDRTAPITCPSCGHQWQKKT